MRQAILALSAITLLAAPAHADDIDINNWGSPDWTSISFGLDGFSLLSSLDPEFASSWVLPHDAALRAADITIESSRFIEKSIDGTTTRYRFGRTTLSMALEVAADAASPSVIGEWKGRLDGFEFEVFNEDEFGDCGCVEFHGTLERGRLDGDLARALGVKRRTGGGEWHILMEQLHQPYADDREGVAQLEIAIDTKDRRHGHHALDAAPQAVVAQAVPEPGAAVLIGLGALAVAVRRTTSRR